MVEVASPEDRAAVARGGRLSLLESSIQDREKEHASSPGHRGDHSQVVDDCLEFTHEARSLPTCPEEDIAFKMLTESLPVGI